MPNLDHTAWQLVFHLQTAQSDILEFCRDADHISPDYPSGYWPASPAPESEEQWKKAIASFRKDLQDTIDLVKDPDSNLRLFSNEVALGIRPGVPVDRKRIEEIADAAGGTVVGFSPPLRLYLIEIAGDGTADGVQKAINAISVLPRNSTRSL